MAKFRFVVRSPQGKARRGTVTEDTMADARASLQKAGYEVIELFEETDIVIHQHKSSSGKKIHKPTRAKIIDFELTAGERFGEFLSKFVLRREVALLLLVAGICWMAISYVNSEPPPAPVEPTLYDLKLTVQVDLNSMEGERVVLSLPEVPYSTEQTIGPGSEQTLPAIELDLQLEKQVSKLELNLLDRDKKSVARATSPIQVGPDPQTLELRLAPSKER